MHLRAFHNTMRWYLLYYKRHSSCIALKATQCTYICGGWTAQFNYRMEMCMLGKTNSIPGIAMTTARCKKEPFQVLGNTVLVRFRNYGQVVARAD